MNEAIIWPFSVPKFKVIRLGFGHSDVCGQIEIAFSRNKREKWKRKSIYAITISKRTKRKIIAITVANDLNAKYCFSSQRSQPADCISVKIVIPKLCQKRWSYALAFCLLWIVFIPIYERRSVANRFSALCCCCAISVESDGQRGRESGAAYVSHGKSSFKFRSNACLARVSPWQKKGGHEWRFRQRLHAINGLVFRFRLLRKSMKRSAITKSQKDTRRWFGGGKWVEKTRNVLLESISRIG